MENTGSRWLEKTLIILPWAAIPILALHFSAVRNELPARIAVHFDLNGRPNGWQSPEMFLGFATLFLLLAIAVMSFVLLRAFRLRSMATAVTLIHYFTVGVLFVVFWQILDHAAFGRGMSQIWPMPGALPVLAIIFAILALAQMPRTKTQPSPEGVLIAEEQHRSPMQLFFILPGLAVGLWLAIKLAGPPRLLGVFLIAVMAWVGVAVLEGFKYLVRSDGVQVKGFLLPLRFIPRSSIHSYRTEPWKGLGYGIRLTSTGTAYIWGGKNVVNIATDHGNVMLGHYSPERLIGELDRMMQASS
jgi:Protein of unknown function (DUF1648)